MRGRGISARDEAALFYNGRIITFDRRKPGASSIVTENGRIAGVGDDREVRRIVPQGADRVDLCGKIVVPGFIDCHTHFIQMGVDYMHIDLSKTRVIDEAIALMGAGAKKIPEGDWVIGTGWKESGWPSGRFITGEDLDACCPKHPAVAHRVCGHLSSVNSKAIGLLGIDARTPGADTSPSGALTGILKEGAVSIVREATRPDNAKKLRGLALAVRRAHSFGVTSITDNGASEDFDIFRSAERDGKLRVRVWFNSPHSTLDARCDLSLSTGIGSEWLKFGGLKVFCDGALGARTAALSEPFTDDPGNTGMFVHDRHDLDGMVSRANDADIQLAIHAIGDAAIDVSLTSIASALRRTPRKDHRHRIEHLELPSPSHLLRVHQLGLLASMQPNFIGEWGGKDGMYVSRLGEERASRSNPFMEILKAKVRLVFGSDCMPFSPLYGIHSAANAPYPSQRIPPIDAIAAYTRDAAYASFEEHSKGTLSVGKLADFVVLSSDPRENLKTISSIKVLKTIVGGNMVFERSGGKLARGH